jgi:hypothetical protein
MPGFFIRYPTDRTVSTYRGFFGSSPSALHGLMQAISAVVNHIHGIAERFEVILQKAPRS